MALFQTDIEVARYSGRSRKIFVPSSVIQSFDADKVSTTLLSSENATEVTLPEQPSSVCSAAPVAGSQSRTVLSCDPDAIHLPSGEKASGTRVHGMLGS